MYTALRDETKKFFSEEVKLADDEYYSIGRSLQNNIVIEDFHISGTHCELLLFNNTWFIYDKNSNGTKVNGISLGKYDVVSLQDGDRIDLNDVQTFQFVRRGNLNKSSKPMNGSTCSEWKVETTSIPIPERLEPSSQDKKCRGMSKDVSSKKPKTVARNTAMHPTSVIDNSVAKVIESTDEKTKNLREQLVQERERLEVENTDDYKIRWIYYRSDIKGDYKPIFFFS